MMAGEFWIRALLRGDTPVGVPVYSFLAAVTRSLRSSSDWRFLPRERVSLFCDEVAGW